MPVKLTEVARHAGVSLATASRVLNGSARKPAPEIAERVKASAIELGYVANAQAQALARSTTGLIGLVVHDIADPYFSTIAHGVAQEAHAQGKQVLLAGTDDAGTSEAAAVNAFVSYRTDAIILAASRLEVEDPELSGVLQRYVASGGTLVTLGETAIPEARVLAIDNELGAYELVTALIERGTKRFIVLAGPSERNTARHRVQGFLRAMEGNGIQPLKLIPGPFTRQGGFDAALEAIDFLHNGQNDAGLGLDAANSDGPICLLAVNDVMALGAMTALRSKGFKVPEEIQVAGFDDIPTLRDHSPSLTTYRLPLEAIGLAAAQIALNRSDPEQLLLPERGEVVIRESAGKP